MDSVEHRSDTDSRLESQIYEHQQHSQLSSAELGDLWSNYMGDSMFLCIFAHFLEIVKDEEIKNLLVLSQNISKRHLSVIAELFLHEGIPVPAGFGQSDVYKEAPRLFDDVFMLFYMREMTIGGLGQYTRAFTGSTRQDVMDFYRQCIQETNEIYERVTHLLLEKGIIAKSPNIPYPKKVEFVENKSFNSFFLGKNRPIAASEIKYLNLNISTNVLGKSIMMGFSQVASSKKLRKYFQNGMELADKQIKQFAEILANDNIPSPMLMDPYVTDSQVPPFSDRLMLYHVGLANQMGIENMGVALSKTLRHDIHGKYGKFITEIGVYANQGQQLMIDHGWLEKPPLAADRDKIINNPLQ